MERNRHFGRTDCLIWFRCQLLFALGCIKGAFCHCSDVIAPFHLSQWSLLVPPLKSLKVLWSFQVGPCELWSPSQTPGLGYFKKKTNSSFTYRSLEFYWSYSSSVALDYLPPFPAGYRSFTFSAAWLNQCVKLWRTSAWLTSNGGLKVLFFTVSYYSTRTSVG